MRCDMNRVPARFAITLTFLGSFTGIVDVQTRLPRVPGAHVVTITPPGQVGSEPAIAVNPNNPDQVVGAAGSGLAPYCTDCAHTFTPLRPAGGKRPSACVVL